MSQQTSLAYGWIRYVFPADAAPLLDADGFLPEPGAFLNSQGRAVDEVIAIGTCVTLLGPPGIGKSTVLWDAWQRAASGPGRAVHVHAGRVRDVHEHLERSEAMRAWRQKPDASLAVFVDALDESLVRSSDPVGAVVASVVGLVERLPLDRVSLVFACRSGAWSADAAAAVDRLARAMEVARVTDQKPEGQPRDDAAAAPGETKHVPVWELAPLRRSDVEAAARTRGLEAHGAGAVERLLAMIDERGLGILASRPLTLGLLFNLYEKDGSLPAQARVLFEHGCLQLCERLGAAGLHQRGLDAPVLDAEQRLAIAMRIAAITVLCNRPRVVLGADARECPDDAVRIADIVGCGPDERVGAMALRVTARMVVEALGTDLFEAHRGEARWVHHELAEFLASRWLARHGFAVHQVMALVGYGGDQDTLVPQMDGLARWIDDVFPVELRRGIMAINPLAALRGDVAGRSDEEREFLVDALLDALRTGRLLDAFAIMRRAEILAHPGLAAQLAPVLRGAGEPARARMAAAFIAGRCGVLLDELAGLATSGSAEPYDVRFAAAVGVGDADAGLPDATRARARLRAVLDAAPDIDPDDDLRGVALKVVWSDPDLQVTELLGYLVPPQKPNRFGLYKSFLCNRELAAQMWDRASPVERRNALDWAIEHEDLRWAEPLVRRLWERALQHLDCPEIVGGVAHMVRQRVARHRPISWVREHLDARGLRVLLAHLLDDAQLQIASLVYASGGRLLRREDRPWVLAWLDDEQAPERHVVLCRLVIWLTDLQDETQHMDLVERYQGDPARYAEFRSFVLCDAQGEVADRLRAVHAQRVQHEQEMAALDAEHQYQVHIWSEDDLEQALTAIAQGDARAWLKLAHIVWFDEEEAAEGLFWRHTIEQSPAWGQADGLNRERMFDAAEQYLRYGDPRTGEWLGTSHMLEESAAGLHALALLAREAPARLVSVEPEALIRWVPAIIEGRASLLDAVVAERLVDCLKPHAHEILVSTLQSLLEREQERIHMHRWHAWWISELAPLLVAHLQDAEPSERTAALLEYLVRHAPTDAQPIMDRWLSSPLDSADARNYFAFAIRLALDVDAARYWPILRARLQDDPVHGVDLIRKISVPESDESDTWLDKIALEELAWLYDWSRQRSLENNAKGALSARVEHLSERLVRHLAARGSWEAVAALRRLTSRYPEDGRLPWLLAQAEDDAKRATWISPAPEVVLALAADPARWWVVHPGQLQQALVHVLARTGSIEPRRFWEREPGDAHRPLDERGLRQVVCEELGQQLARVVHGTPPRVFPHGNGMLRIEAGRDPAGATIAVDVVIVPSWAVEPTVVLDVLAAPGAHATHAVVILAWFAGRAWTRRADHERRRRALRRDRADVQRALEQWSPPDGMRVAVQRLDLDFDERADELDHLPWGRVLREQLAAWGARVCSVCSIGDREHWQVRVALPDSLRDRFGLAPQALLVACQGPVRAADAARAQDVLALANAESDHGDLDLDPDLLVIADDAPGLDSRLERLPGRPGQWVPWPAPAFSPLEAALAHQLRQFDVFDQHYPARGRQFFGRIDEAAELRRRVLRGEAAGIFGLRKSGKTSLARAVTDALDPVSVALSNGGSPASVDVVPRMCVVWLDVQSLTERSERALWNALLERTGERIGAGGGRVPPANGDVFVDLERSLRVLLDAASSVGPGALCIALDEYDLLFEGSGGEPGVPVLRLLRLLRGLAQETGRLSALFLGRDSNFLEARYIEGVSNPMRSWVHAHWVTSLEPVDADDLLGTLGRRAGRDIGPTMCALARIWTGCYPSLLRHFGSALLAVAEEPGNEASRVTSDPNQVVERYLDRDQVQVIQDETFSLLRDRYQPAYALLCELLACGHREERKDILAKHGGWLAAPAKVLRRFGILVGTSQELALLHWVQWYAREVLDIDVPEAVNPAWAEQAG
jgi:hypothetical protein